MNNDTIQKIITLLKDIDDFYWINGEPLYDIEKKLSKKIRRVLETLGLEVNWWVLKEMVNGLDTPTDTVKEWIKEKNS